jgi:hypothetical protein
VGILAESGARKLLADVEFDLRECVRVGWHRWRREVAPLLSACSSRGRANIVWEFIVDEARRRFPGVTVNEDEGRFVLILHQQINVVFKKLSDEGVPSNYPTQTALAFARQPELPHMFDFARVTVGYELNELGTELTSVSANCFNGLHVVWRYELPDRPAKLAVVPMKKKGGSAEGKPAAKRVRRKAGTDPLRVIKGGKKDDNS